MIRYSSKYLFKRFFLPSCLFLQTKTLAHRHHGILSHCIILGIWFNFNSLDYVTVQLTAENAEIAEAVREETEKLWGFSPLFYYFSAFSAPFAVNYYESIYARVVELADTPDSKSGPRHRGKGSTPFSGISFKIIFSILSPLA